MRVLATGIGLALSLSAAHAEGPILLPSGVEAAPFDTIWDEELSVIRLRFTVPRLAEPGSLYSGDPERVFEDMLWLCETQLSTAFPEGPAWQEQGWNAVVISLMDRPIEFGTRDPDVFQVFEWFSLTMDGCEMELDDYHD